MAKVEMSIDEYNALMNDLKFYSEVVKELTTPSPSSWDREWYSSHPSSSLSLVNNVTLENISHAYRARFRELVENNIKDYIQEYGIEGTVDADDSRLCQIHFGYMNHILPETEEVDS